jgi:hypothetical protein
MKPKNRLISSGVSKRSFFLGLAFLFNFSVTLGQTTVLKNSIDSSLAIKTIAVAPMFDNVSQIYAKPLTAQMRNIVTDDHQWDVRSWPESIKNTPEEFEDQPEAVKAALKKASADALISTRLTKGPNGISIRMNLFLGQDGLLLAQETLSDYSGFEIADLRSQLEAMYGKLKAKLPYSGVILSRKGQQLTINMGSQQGVKEGAELSVVQIIKLARHPRFKFVVSTEKEIIGRIHVDKVEQDLSFGTLILERSENVVQPGMKLIPINFVSYPGALRGGDGKAVNELGQRPDGQISLGEHPREWIPLAAPTFGKIGLLLGLGTYAISNTLSTAGAVDATNTLVPSIHVDGELWLTTNWFVNFGLKQYVFSLDNSYTGSRPGRLSVSTSRAALNVGYNFLMSDQFFGPKFQLMGGYMKMSSVIDTSAPMAFTSMNFGGMAIGLGGSFPLSPEVPVTLGARMLHFLTTSVDESPVTSGDSSSGKITTFSAYGTYQISEHINFKGEMMYDLFSASFSGVGDRSPDSASSASHALTTFAGGIEYLF